MISRLLPLLAAALLGAVAHVPAQAQIVNIDATVSGCDINHCNGQHPLPGTVLGSVINPVQLTLGPGSYSITDANGLPGADPNLTSWRFNGASNWVWSFMVVDDATRTVLVDACCGPVFATQSGAATQPFAVNYATTLSLASTTTLDFVVEDYYLPDNAGGISVQVAAVPEPASWALMAGGIAALLHLQRRRRAS